jgi:uncharacterized protein
MTERLPLFPLGTVLFPGLVLPLHIFEERYRTLVADRRDAGTFGVVAIRTGFEVGTEERVDLHPIGCSTEIRQISELDDGQFDLVTVGRRRFRIVELHTDVAPYLVADVEWVTEEDDGGAAEKLVPGVLDVFQRYLELIRTDGHQATEQLPDDPTVLSYLVAATAVLPLDERQQLLACATTRERLATERRLLNRELVLLQTVNALPVPLNDLSSPPSAN